MTPPRLGENFMVKMIQPGEKIETKYYVPAGSHGPVTLKSGGEVKEEILLSQKFDMSGPGEYIIQAGPVGPVPPDDLKVLAWSNSIAVKVVKFNKYDYGVVVLRRRSRLTLCPIEQRHGNSAELSLSSLSERRDRDDMKKER
jgi:hypothetical protein